MISAPKNSILRRPLKAPSQKNNENMDTEHERNQQRLKAKQQRYQEQEEYRRKCLYATPGEKKNIWAEKQQEQQDHLAMKAQSKVAEIAFDKELAQHYDKQQCFCKEMERDQESLKRVYLKSIMDENKAMVAEKKAREQAEKENERRREREAISFWDRAPRSFR
eukprot:TRINITY_DN112633_c0_g1_i1.p1 TRINITY_DN112633_c0_g1~~TRINITY_DN112633_c0_g1_i1.p1  ORF type:complete len:164 (+),score=29.63 TRINITY_DN112633_c0_g1_i1:42-533(+)